MFLDIDILSPELKQTWWMLDDFYVRPYRKDRNVFR